jgi:hypothetical protein
VAPFLGHPPATAVAAATATATTPAASTGPTDLAPAAPGPTVPPPPAASEGRTQGAGFLHDLRQLIEAAQAVVVTKGGPNPAPAVLAKLAAATDRAAPFVDSSGCSLSPRGLRAIVEAIAPSLWLLCTQVPQLIDMTSEHVCVQALFSPCVFVLLTYVQEVCPGKLRAFG